MAKVFSVLSDHLRQRKGLAILGYSLAALTKPLFPLANSAATVFSARFLDRIGKGIRGAPRDALVADLTPPTIRGARPMACARLWISSAPSGVLCSRWC